MPITVSHPFVSVIPDKPSDFGAGKVTPSRWNQNHTVSGGFGANEITNIPAGTITATNVQAAVNQLASLIPSPGPGTDPLFLTKGLSVAGYNNTLYPASDTFTLLSEISQGSDGSSVQPVFSNISALQISIFGTNGQATYNATTQSKLSFMPLRVNGIYNASGQKFLYNNNLISYGMSDTSIWANNYVQFAGGPINGDEGQGWGVVSNLSQQGFLQSTTISQVPAPSIVNTTTTQPIVRSKDAQTVNVASTAGAVNGDWIVVEQAVESNGLNTEAVQIISFTPTSITGIFRCNHALGVTITPALVLWCHSTFQMGQDRFLINYSQPSYSVGQVSTIVGGGMDFIGGPALANNIVGGNATNIGCIALACDDYIGAPFGAVNPLKDWYQIIAVTTPTHLAVNSFSVAGDISYKGKGTFPANLPTNYIIRPSARVLRILDDGAANVTGQIICETSTSTWTVGDSVGQAICPYPDVTGFQYSPGSYSAGGTYRSFMTIKNVGARTFQNCFFVDGWGTIFEPTADGLAWGTVFGVSAPHEYGLHFRQTTKSVLNMSSPNTDGAATTAWTRISWDGSTGPRIEYETTNNFGLSFYTTATTAPIGLLQFSHPGTIANPDLFDAMMAFGGNFRLFNPNTSGTLPGYMAIDKLTGLVDYESGFLGWSLAAGHDVFEIGTINGGAGIARDLVLKTGNAEQLRLIAGANIKFTAAANFSANGGVATALTNVGPAGSHTTVQKWLTIVDDTGATVYIPCF